MLDLVMVDAVGLELIVDSRSDRSIVIDSESKLICFRLVNRISGL